MKEGFGVKKVLLILLLVLAVDLSASAEESTGYTWEQLEALQVMGIPVAAEEREHDWREVGSGTQSQYVALLNEQQRVDMGDYHNVYTYSIYECRTCRSRQTMPQAQAEQHLYAVLSCEKKKDAQNAYNVTYRCELCGHVRIDILYLPTMTYEEFMSPGERTDLPYLLIDQLREENKAK